MEPTVLILAGQRGRAVDPLARSHGLTHKAMIRVEGQALIGHVLQSIECALPHCRTLVSIDHWPAIASEPTVARLHKAGRLEHVRSRETIYESLMLVASERNFPLIVTTADNALLTPEAVAELCKAGAERDCAIVGLARREAIESVHPAGKGRYYEFKDGAFSNCNLFWIGSRSTLQAADTFREGGQFLKVKGRLMRAFGLVNLLLFQFRLLTLSQMFARVSRRLHCDIIPLVFDDGRLAIDVDDARSLTMVSEILAADAASHPRESQMLARQRTA